MHRRIATAIALLACSIFLALPASARGVLDLNFDFSRVERADERDALVDVLPEGMLIAAKTSNLLRFVNFDLPKNAMFRNRFRLDAGVYEVRDHGIAGISLGNRKLDLVFYVFRHDRTGYARIATADSSQTNFILEKKITYPSMPFSLGIRYDVAAGEFAGTVNGEDVVSITSDVFPSLTNISSVGFVSVVAGSRYDQDKGGAVFSSLGLQAE